MTSAFVPAPKINVTDGTPSSIEFGDVYFSRAGGVAETKHVFLQGNGLPERWKGRTEFTIAELGFGTGLNFLTTWKKFLETSEPSQQLHYISIEKFPWICLRDVLALQPELSELTEKLIAAYPLRLPGWHRLEFERVTLTLGYGDIAELLPQLTTKIDAWFLDGFSPAKNPEMWTDQIFVEIARHSSSDATLATFTAAGQVKRGLEANGFILQKVAGFGHKRDMLVGHRDGTREVNPKPKTAIVIGAGIAGASMAHALATRGVKVMVIERSRVASQASGNLAAVLFPQLSKRWNHSTAWYFSCFDFMQRKLKQLNAPHHIAGMLRLPRHAEDEAQLRTLNEQWGIDKNIFHWVECDEASRRAGVALTTGAAFLPQGTWLEPAAFCKALLAHENIALKENCEVVSLKNSVKTKQNETFTADIICVAAAADASHLLPDLKLNRVGGQVSLIDASDVTAPLKTILCHKGYVIPLKDSYLIGATYNHDDAREVTEENHAANVAEVETFLPGWISGKPRSGRMSERATTPDRMPYIGKLSEGLYVSTGHGSRGMLSAPLGGELIASMVMGEQLPVTDHLRAAVDPLRFKRS